MIIEWIRTTIILPINVLVFIPAILLYVTGYRWEAVNPVFGVIGVVLFIFGLIFAGWTMRLFATRGKGTAAPWNPPKKLVVSGPYKHVRNP
ncbi:MAG: hypothetical protein LBH59_09910, partial [Planctomycetaceae bacterium]|nr:hypothetical protein [Planctomycetaceae bacterium]